MTTLTDLDSVQDRVGKLGGARDLKVIDFIDEHAARWLGATSLCFLAIGKAGELGTTMVGDEPGFLSVNDSKVLDLPLAAFDEPELAIEGRPYGALFLVPGMNETLRINGTVYRLNDSSVTLYVEECYLHCAKALLRSDFWQAELRGDVSVEPSALIDQVRFLSLATIGSEGPADVSPKGDPADTLLKEIGGTLCFADRPGNRRIDSFRNILEEPQVSVLGLVPGFSSFLQIHGTAALSTEESLLSEFTVQGKAPNLVTKISPEFVRVKESAALKRAELWPVSEAPQELKGADIFKAHMNLSKEKGLGASVARTLVSVPGLLRRALDSDYDKNMY